MCFVGAAYTCMLRYNAILRAGTAGKNELARWCWGGEAELYYDVCVCISIILYIRAGSCHARRL